MTSKEALEKIKNIELHHIEYEIDDYYDDDYVFEKSDGTIEEKYPDEIQVIEKELKVLEIIKKKRVNVRAFLKCCHREDGLLIYNNQCDNKSVAESKELTQEEFDLLKERLNENNN